MTSHRPLVGIDAHSIGRRATGNEMDVSTIIDGLAAGQEVDQIAPVDGDADIADVPAAMLARLDAIQPIRRLRIAAPEQAACFNREHRAATTVHAYRTVL